MVRFLGKRKRVNAPRRSVRRRFGRNNFKRNSTGRRITSFSTRSSAANGLAYRGRRLPKRVWNRMLWRDTMFQTHYRSVACANNPLTTPASVGLANVNRLEALPSLGFWTAAGGALTADTAVALPLFNNSIVIRGGRIWIEFCNNDADAATSPSVVEVTVCLVRTSFDPDFTSVPVSAARGFDISMMPDFSTRIGKLLLVKKFLIRPFETMSVEYRLPIRKIDAGIMQATGGSSWQWFVIYGNVTDGVATVLQETRGHNLSFVADATT